MLVLTRDTSGSSTSKVRIGDDVTVTVRAIRGGKVTLSIDAPREMTIMRKEAIGRGKQGSAS